MTLRRQIPELRIDLRPSFILAGALAAGHLAAMVAAALVLEDMRCVVPAWVGLTLHGCWTVRSHALLLHSRSVISLAFFDETQCMVRRRDRKELNCRVKPSSYLTAPLIVLALEGEGCRSEIHVVVMPDSSSGEMLRRLRVRLRWGRLGRSRTDSSL